ncbi:MAG: hypothetical protein ABI446_02390 [Gemmatimonadaceae bacterium]
MVDIVDAPRDPSELIAARLAVAFSNDLHVLDEWPGEITVRTACAARARVRRQRGTCVRRSLAECIAREARDESDEEHRSRDP